jgi:GMP synthase (glutamine-hydrolysing)
MSVERPTILVIQNDATCPLGRFEGAFDQAGVAVDVRRGFAHDDMPDEARDVDGVIVLGGAMGANDAALHPWLTTVQQLIRSAVQDEIPLLGICLGVQLAAVALGGEVVVNPNGRAAGLVPIGPIRAADPLLGDLPAGQAAIQWNDDVVRRLPPHAEVLAESPDGTPQAIRFGPLAWGVQFHPEATPAIFRSWLDEAADANSDADFAAGQAVTEADDHLRILANLVAGRFVDVCRTARPDAERAHCV